MLEQPGRTQIRSENFTAKRPGIAGWQPTLCSRAANQHPPGILQRFLRFAVRGLSRDWGSCHDGCWRMRIVGGLEALPEAGAECAVVDGAADLEQPIGPAPR